MGEDRRKLQNLREEWRNKCLEGKNGENSLQRSLLTNTSQLRNCLCALIGEWGLGAEAQA